MSHAHIMPNAKMSRGTDCGTSRCIRSRQRPQARAIDDHDNRPHRSTPSVAVQSDSHMLLPSAVVAALSSAPCGNARREVAQRGKAVEILLHGCEQQGRSGSTTLQTGKQADGQQHIAQPPDVVDARTERLAVMVTYFRP